jgi:hypothetical protein
MPLHNNASCPLEAIESLLSGAEHPSLNQVQITILEETWAGHSYSQIADRFPYTIDYLREVGAKLWQTLADVLGEAVTKKNVVLVLQRYCAANKVPDNQKYLARTTLERQYSWGEAIDVSVFYGREQELETLTQWVRVDRCRLISLLAIGGMGKTALAVKLAQQLTTEFEFVVWRSLRNGPMLGELLAEAIGVFSDQQEIELPIEPMARVGRLIHHLQQHRCLLILDNVESILQGGNPRHYLPGYEDYGELFRQLTECAHQSCVVLTGREQIEEVANYAGPSLPVRVLPLGGLSLVAAIDVLADKQLYVDLPTATALVDLYDGNPLALKISSRAIVELFGGDVAEFFQRGVAVFNGIELVLEHQFDRLSEIEMQVMFWLAISSGTAGPNEREWVTVAELQEDLWPMVLPAQLLGALEYLQGRSLIECKGCRFTQKPVVMEYVTGRLLAQVRAEVIAASPQFLLRYALMKAQSKEYVRESQMRIILSPLLEMLESDLGRKEAIAQVLKQLLVV